MNFTDDFTSTIAILGEKARDGRMLSSAGEWTGLFPAPVIHQSSGVQVGEILEMDIAGNELYVTGRAVKTIAEVLDADTFKLALDMDNVGHIMYQPGDQLVIMAGRIRGAYMVKAEDWLWA